MSSLSPVALLLNSPSPSSSYSSSFFNSANILFTTSFINYSSSTPFSSFPSCSVIKLFILLTFLLCKHYFLHFLCLLLLRLLLLVSPVRVLVLFPILLFPLCKRLSCHIFLLFFLIPLFCLLALVTLRLFLLRGNHLLLLLYPVPCYCTFPNHGNF